MTEHYYQPTTDAPSDPVEITAQVRGLTLQLTSDRGVFSREHADPGSLLLLKHAELPPQGDILDLGCGYGILGLGAALLAPEARVVLVDVNERAADLARQNLIRHSVANGEVLTGDAREVLGDRAFDAVLCNPPYRAGKALVMALIADAARRLRPGGALWLVGRTKLGIKTLARDIAPHFDSVETVTIKGGYRVIVGRKS